jgi:hypothetical protein
MQVYVELVVWQHMCTVDMYGSVCAQCACWQHMRTLSMYGSTLCTVSQLHDHSVKVQ